MPPAFKIIARLLTLMLGIFLSTPMGRCSLRSSITAQYSLLSLLYKNLAHSHGVPQLPSSNSSSQLSAQISSTVRYRSRPNGLRQTIPRLGRGATELLPAEPRVHDPGLSNRGNGQTRPFNSQSARIVVLLKKDHEKLWDMTRQILQLRMLAEQFEATAKKLDVFRNAYGSVRVGLVLNIGCSD